MTEDFTADFLALQDALAGRYSIERELGRGGMGIVLLARDVALDRLVAIKLLPPDLAATPELRDRFLREARTAAGLSHPNIVPIHIVEEHGDFVFFVMGYVDGETLRQRVERAGPISPRYGMKLLQEVAWALAYAHQRGIVHRDIKPDNVLIEEGTGRAMLMDFGVAKALGAGETMTEVGSVLGTPQYMSPEQAQGKADIDHRSDLYSLGVMGYAMLAGRLPFEGPAAGDIMAQHITNEAPSLKMLASETPVEIASALTRCLAKDRKQRWPGASSLRVALTPQDAGETPEGFEDLASLFRAPLGAGYILILLAAWWLGGGDVSDPFPVAPKIVGAIGVLLSLILVFKYWQLRKEGFEASRIVREIFMKPEGFVGWYPRRFRRVEDIWDRLPKPLRQARASLSWALLVTLIAPPFALFLIAFNSHIIRTGRSPLVSRPDPAFLLVMLPMFGAAVVLVARWQRFGRAHGLDAQTLKRALRVPTTKKAFWVRPEVDALLRSPGPTAVAQRSPATTPEMAAAISAAFAGAGDELLGFATRAREVARELAQAVTALDHQIGALASAVDPAEAGRLIGRLAAIGPDLGSTDINGEVREILQKQLDTIRKLEARVEDAQSRRAEGFELLKALWVQGVELRAAGSDPVRATETIDRLRRLFALIERRSALTESPGNAATDVLSDSPTLER